MTIESTFDRSSVAAWMEYIQTLHAREIEMSLDRVREVFLRLCPGGFTPVVISVAGTNGKGSTCAVLASIYQLADHAVGKFTSPHLMRFNERFQINGKDVRDRALIVAFEAVESARGDTPITYFEYGLLLALALFQQHRVDVAIMEVGLGGRLDAVNILDADVSIITSIALDHTAWLGDTLEQIAFEKAGIARAGRPCLVGLRQPQDSMLQHLRKINAETQRLGREFDYLDDGGSDWAYKSDEQSYKQLPLPFSQRGVQLDNASLAIRCIQTLSARLPVDEQALRAGLANAALAGRCQILQREPTILLDVSHNEASLSRLADFVHSLTIGGRIIAVCGMLKDKEISASLAQISPLVGEWHLASIDAERGSSAAHIEHCLQGVFDKQETALSDKSVFLYEDVRTAFRVARATLTADDCLVVFGSFFVAGDILGLLSQGALE